jgi:hypothetical protein
MYAERPEDQWGKPGSLFSNLDAYHNPFLDCLTDQYAVSHCHTYHNFYTHSNAIGYSNANQNANPHTHPTIIHRYRYHGQRGFKKIADCNLRGGGYC